MSDVERKKPRITEFGPCHDEMQEIESLRQRVKDFEAENQLAWNTCGEAEEQRNRLQAELAVLKAGQGDPVGVMRKVEVPSNSMNEQFSIEPDMFIELPEGTKLYTAPTIPEGYVLVPVEPTDSMAEAWRNGDGFNGRYKALLAAAPKPKERRSA